MMRFDTSIACISLSLVAQHSVWGTAKRSIAGGTKSPMPDDTAGVAARSPILRQRAPQGREEPGRELSIWPGSVTVYGRPFDRTRRVVSTKPRLRAGCSRMRNLVLPGQGRLRSRPAGMLRIETRWRTSTRWRYRPSIRRGVTWRCRSAADLASRRLGQLGQPRRETLHSADERGASKAARSFDSSPTHKRSRLLVSCSVSSMTS
jgi:hypothetical protein